MRGPSGALPGGPERSAMRVLRRSLAGLTCAAVLVGGSAIALADEPEPYRAQAVSAARWLVGELATAADVAAYDAANPATKGRLVEGTLPGQFVSGPAPTDWGLTIDALLALKATGADDAAANKIADVVAANVGGFIGSGGPETLASGAVAKELVAAVVSGRNPREFGGFDLVTELTGLMAKDGDEKGRFKNRAGEATLDNSNLFGQALGVIGLAQVKALPPEAVDFLVKQQCPAGGFRLVPSGTACTDDGGIHIDATGMAVQALFDADEAGVTGAKDVAAKAVAYLKTAQGTNGEFSDMAKFPNPNMNSTGLAAQALAAGGEQAATDPSPTSSPSSSSSSTTASTTADAGAPTTGSGDGSQTPRNLASTGAEAGGFAFGGLALLVAGLGLVLIARQRSAA